MAFFSLFFFPLLLLPPHSPSAPVPWRRIQQVTPTLTSSQPHGVCFVFTHGCCVVWVLTCSELCCCSLSPLLSVKLSQEGRAWQRRCSAHTTLTSMAAVSLVGMRAKGLCLPGYQSFSADLPQPLWFCSLLLSQALQTCPSLVLQHRYSG